MNLENSEADSIPLVTVAIPTFKRPECLRKSLESVILQNYGRLEIIVGDNDWEFGSAEKIISEFSGEKKIKYVRSATPKTAKKNFFDLLLIADGEYFMWLADDDQLEGENYISNLLCALNSSSNVVCAFATWKLFSSECEHNIIKTKEYKSDFWFIRAISFIWHSTDDFFYGLYKIGALRKASIESIKPLSWPNHLVSTNCVYPFLLDLVIQGKIVRDISMGVFWQNHDYTSKFYQRTSDIKKSLVHGFFLIVTRRINIHFRYAKEVGRKAIIFWPICILTSTLSLSRDSLKYLISRFFRSGSSEVSKRV